MYQISASEFKARCLALLDDVAATGEPMVITKRGRPLARLIAVENLPSLIASVEFFVSDDELAEPLFPDYEPPAPPE